MIDETLGRNAALSAAQPLSRPLTITEVPSEGLEAEIVATEGERAALAEMNDIPAVLSLTATLRARRWRGEGLEVTGELRARVRQTCVVTLEEFESDVVEPIDLRFAPPQQAPRPRSRRRDAEPEPAEHDAMGEDPPDPLVGGAVDLGQIASEFLTLALDPYPRRPGAEFVEPAPEKADDAVSPFARLSAARDKA
ncbi:YceD family protein [Methylocystis sp. JAN1]|uniref:YceD family protein n=1 Tax=Methylocystis sp. JAN1 TaxID=3397211 RepID=UPI003FA2EEE1